MEKKLKERFRELKQCGLVVDERRGAASVSLSARLDLSSGEPGKESLSLDEDDLYLWAPFRALSASYISERGIDFSREGVLKKSYRLLKGQTVYSNHSRDVNDWLGVVAKTWWDESGVLPPGINTTLKIKKKWNERIVDGIKEGAVHSASVDVYFEYEKSHPDLEDFWFHLGEEIEGNIVRMIAVKIISYGEISLVWQGADAFAKRIGLSKGNEDSGSLPERDNTNITGGKTMKLSRSFAVLLGLTLSDYGFGTAQEVELDEGSQIKFMSDLARGIENLRSEKDRYNTILKDLLGKDFNPAKIEDLKTGVSMGAEYLKDMRQDAVKYAKLAEGVENLNEPLEKAIMGASLEDAKKFRDQYRAKAEEKFPAKCPKCGESLSRASAQGGRSDGETGEEPVNPKDYDF